MGPPAVSEWPAWQESGSVQQPKSARFCSAPVGIPPAGWARLLGTATQVGAELAAGEGSRRATSPSPRLDTQGDGCSCIAHARRPRIPCQRLGAALKGNEEDKQQQRRRPSTRKQHGAQQQGQQQGAAAGQLTHAHGQRVVVVPNLRMQQGSRMGHQRSKASGAAAQGSGSSARSGSGCPAVLRLRPLSLARRRWWSSAAS